MYSQSNSAITPECTALLERVRQAKRLNKLSVETIAKEAGMHRPTVQNQLYGRYNLDIRVVMAIARLCPNISCNWLLRGEGDMLQPTANITTNAPTAAQSQNAPQPLQNDLKNALKSIEKQLFDINTKLCANTTK